MSGDVDYEQRYEDLRRRLREVVVSSPIKKYRSCVASNVQAHWRFLERILVEEFPEIDFKSKPEVRS